jgi:hypothetical protein
MAPTPKLPAVSPARVILAQAIFSIIFAVLTVAVVDFIMWAANQ